MVQTTLADAQVRAARQTLAERMGRLEDRVVDTVDDARTAVDRTVRTVTGSIDDAAHSVRSLAGSAGDSITDALDISKRVRENPIGSAAVAVGLGLAAWLLTRQTASTARTAVPGTPGPFAQILDVFKDELMKVGQDAAVTASKLLKEKIHTVLEPEPQARQVAYSSNC